MNRVLGITMAAALLAGTAVTSSAFDGNRKGFVLGFGVGPSVSTFTQTLTGLGPLDGTSEPESKGGLATSFKIGGGFNEQWMLYYVNNVAWFSITNALDKEVTIANGVGLVGVSYYLSPDKPAMYLLGIIGVSTWGAIFEEDASSSSGFGLGGGVGWEFSRHWSLEGIVEWGAPEDTEGSAKLESNAVSFLFMITGLAY